jgi:predicted DNA-binding transcriptional regulator AlpA
MQHDDDIPAVADFRPPAAPFLFTATEAATTCRVSVPTWRTWDASGLIPRPVQIGRAKLWRPQELADWIAAGCPIRAQWHWEPPALPAL